MNILGFSGEVNKVRFSQPSESSIDSIEEIVSRDIIRRLYPLPLEHSPKIFDYIKMREYFFRYLL